MDPFGKSHELSELKFDPVWVIRAVNTAHYGMYGQPHENRIYFDCPLIVNPDFAVLHIPGPPKFNQSYNRPKNGAKRTGMDIGEFTIYNAYLSSVLICLTAKTMVGVVESTTPRVSRVKTYHIPRKSCCCDDG